MKNMLYKAIIFSFIIILSGCSASNISTSGRRESRVKNIIFFIGDGMGTAQVYAGMTISPEPLVLESFPFTGFSKTYSSDNYVTDSGAGGTALACGKKTRNNMIGMGPDSTDIASIVAIAHKNGLATGVLSTASVTHATPASFVAHNITRNDYEGIAEDFLNGTADVFIGGGEDNFRNRKDGKDLTLSLEEQGYDVVYTMDDLKASGSEKIAGLLAKEHMPRVTEGRVGVLAEMTAKAISTLSRNKNGFFLMVEGSMIDWGGHAKDFEYIVSELLDMDEAVGVAKEFAENDGKTLIVVTADHETGGLTLVGGDRKSHQVRSNFIQTGNHTATMVPVFAYGPGSHKFTGIYENTFFLDEFVNLLRISK